MPNRAISKDMRTAIEMLARGGWKGPEIVEILEKVQESSPRVFGNEPVPQLRTVQKYASLPQGATWRLAKGTPAEEARVVLAVVDWLRGIGTAVAALTVGPFAPARPLDDLLTKLEPGWNEWQRLVEVVTVLRPEPADPFPLSHLSCTQAERITTLAAIAPSLTERPDVLYSLATQYELAEDDDTEPLDAFLGARPWESRARAQRFFDMAAHAISQGARHWNEWPLYAAWMLALPDDSDDTSEVTAGGEGGDDDGTG